MPLLTRLPRMVRPEVADLKAKLVAEWNHPQIGSNRPVIVFEKPTKIRAGRIYVIWNDWKTLNQIERSEIIMDAYEEMFGLESSLDVTVAMGLTPVEAKRMGIRFSGCPKSKRSV